MEIPNPRRILILSPPSTNTTSLLNALLAPPPATTTSHLPPQPPSLPSDPTSTELIHHISTPYYTAHIPIWTDTPASGSAFKKEWLALPSAAEVVSAVGAWVVAFHAPANQAEFADVKGLLAAVGKVVEHYSYGGGYGGEEAGMFAVKLPGQKVPVLQVGQEEWEDVGREYGGWEVVDAADTAAPEARNEFGEKTGFPRLLEALATTEWESPSSFSPAFSLSSTSLSSSPEQEQNSHNTTAIPLSEIADLSRAEGQQMRTPILAEQSQEPRSHPTTTLPLAEMAEFSAESQQMRTPILAPPTSAIPPSASDPSSDDDAPVLALQTALHKLQALKDMNAGLPDAERRRRAARAVGEIMRGL